MKTYFIYAGCFLLLLLSGCVSDDLVSEQTDVFVTVKGESAFGTWQRAFVGPEADAQEFAAEAAGIVSAVAEQFEGSIRVDISVDDMPFETIAVSGNDEEIVPAAILAVHDITALRTGFLPQGSLEDIASVASVAGQKPCTCKGQGCCCVGSDCGSAHLSCDGCRWDSYCIGGAMCWFGNEEEN